MLNQHSTDSYQKVFQSVERILIVLAHPDDMEAICGGLVAKLTHDNKLIRLVVATNGGKGFKDRNDVNELNFANHRTNEQIESAKLLGIDETEIYNLNITDGDIDNSLNTIEKIVRHIRDFKPDLIITHNPEVIISKYNNSNIWVNHRDHRYLAESVVDAAYPYSRDRGFFPEHFKEGLDGHCVTKFLFSDNFDTEKSEKFDITNFIDKKRAALQTHLHGLGSDIEPYLRLNQSENDKFFEMLNYIEIGNCYQINK